MGAHKDDDIGDDRTHACYFVRAKENVMPHVS